MVDEGAVRVKRAAQAEDGDTAGGAGTAFD